MSGTFEGECVSSSEDILTFSKVIDKHNNLVAMLPLVSQFTLQVCHEKDNMVV